MNLDQEKRSLDLSLEIKILREQLQQERELQEKQLADYLSNRNKIFQEKLQWEITQEEL